MNKLLVFSGLVATLLVVVGGYNFDDPDYNQELADQLEDMYSSSQATSSNIRNRRDAADEEDKCRKRRPKPCCGEEVLDKLRTDNKDIKDTCFKSITGKDKSERPDKHHHHPRPFDPFDCSKMEQRRSDMLCIHQCVGQKLKFIDNDGNIKPEEYGLYLKGKLAAAKYLEPVQAKIISGCLEEIKNVTATSKSTDKCKPAGIVSDFCIFKQVIVNCPEDQLKDKEYCKKMQERFKQGKEMFMGPPPPHDQ